MEDKSNNNSKEIIITVSGADRPGITAKLMKVISDNNSDITDINQAITHNLLSLSFVLNISSDKDHDQNVLKELLFAAHEMGLKLEYSIIKEDVKYKSPYNSFTPSDVLIIIKVYWRVVSRPLLRSLIL